MYCLWPFSGIVWSLLLCVLTIVDYVRHYFNMPGSNRLIFFWGGDQTRHYYSFILVIAHGLLLHNRLKEYLF